MAADSLRYAAVKLVLQ